jgi:predicted acylesterase/phospholipase RssA
MSCCYPFGFTPIYRDGCCYIDGGIINDYPVNECIRDQKCDLREILGVKMLWERKPANLTEKSSVVQFISTFFNQIKGNLFENRPTKPVPNEVVCVSKVFASQDWINWMKDENYRRECVFVISSEFSCDGGVGWWWSFVTSAYGDGIGAYL